MLSVKAVLSIGAHPDDIEIGCGGTEILLKEQGFTIFHVVVTSGEEGGIEKDKALLKSQRRLEALESAQLLGAHEVTFLGLEDGLTSFSKATKVELIRIIREVRPYFLFTHSKDDCFPDHQIVRSLSESALWGAKGPWYPDAGGTPHSVKHVYGYEVWNAIHQPQCFVDISSSLEKKIAALKCHRSQLSNVRYVAAIEGLSAYRGATAMMGSHAEAFEVVQTALELVSI